MVAPNVIVVANSEVVLANPLNSFEIAYVGLFYLIHFVYFLVLLIALTPFLLVIGNINTANMNEYLCYGEPHLSSIPPPIILGPTTNAVGQFIIVVVTSVVFP